jgi:hypothetical protein
MLTIEEFQAFILKLHHLYTIDLITSRTLFKAMPLICKAFERDYQRFNKSINIFTTNIQVNIITSLILYCEYVAKFARLVLVVEGVSSKLL